MQPKFGLFKLIRVTKPTSYFYCSFKRHLFYSVLSFSGNDKAPFGSERGLNARGQKGRERNSLFGKLPRTGIKSIKEYKKKYFEMGAAIYLQKVPRGLHTRSDEASQLYCRRRWIRLRRFNWAKLIGHSKARARKTLIALKKEKNASAGLTN